MKNIFTILFAVLLISATGNAFAQTPLKSQQQVTIEDGKVIVNGKQVVAGLLPKSLLHLDTNTSLRFWGNEDTLFEISGVVYSVQNGTLIERDPNTLHRNNVSVYFETEKSDVPIRVFGVAPDSRAYIVRSADRSKPMENYVAAMNEKAKEFNTIRFKLDAIQEPQTAEIATQLKLGAENAARIVESFPKVQFEAYLNEIQDADNTLYNTLMREQQMELDTHRLAMKIREASTRTEQEQIAKELRAALNEIFSLKQNNRKMEIEQLSQKLEDLQKRLGEREALRDDIIENRVRELLDQYRW
ncbi:hypothetical protein HQ496_09710 [bacterium]|nr:hypothetical protein [bacterium]